MGKQKILYTVLLDSKFETRPSIIDHRNSRLDPPDARLDPRKFENRVSRIETRVTVNLGLSGTVVYCVEIKTTDLERCNVKVSYVCYNPFTLQSLSYLVLICNQSLDC